MPRRVRYVPCYTSTIACTDQPGHASTNTLSADSRTKQASISGTIAVPHSEAIEFPECGT